MLNWNRRSPASHRRGTHATCCRSDHRDEHVIESEVEVVVPPIIADYVRAVVREAAAMTVEERDQFLYEELVGFEERTTRYRFPDGDVLEAGPDRVVLKHPPDGSVEG